MTDADIIAAVRTGTHVLVPRAKHWSAGDFNQDTFEEFSGERGLMVELTKEQCREVAVAFLYGDEPVTIVK